MRNPSSLIALTIFALAGTASAKEAAHTPEKAAPEKAAPAAGNAVAPAPATAPAAAVTPVAGDVTAAPLATPKARRFQLGLAFLPMAKGRFTASPGGTPKTVDAAFAYGVSLSASYEVLRGLWVGLAPQFTLNVKDKKSPDVAKELDILARVAYAYRPVDTITVYAEVLPGYSLILPPGGGVAKGFVVAFGAGTAMDFTDRYFANIGLGYQIGYQNRMEESTKLQTRTSYVRVTLGGGVRF
jgi:hypothetical protein